MKKCLEMQNKKYTFVQFLCALESEDFDNPDYTWMDWANNYVDSFGEIMKNQFHGGDCTKVPISCMHCQYEQMLSEYRIYYFEEEKFRKEYL
jgi:hypothetical protein